MKLRGLLIAALVCASSVGDAQNYQPAQRKFGPRPPTSRVQPPLNQKLTLSDSKLQVATFNLTPRKPLSDNTEQVRQMAESIVTVVRTLLYSGEGESAAATQGRRLWFDSNTLQLTITDYPDNIRCVSDYIRALPSMEQAKRSEIVKLKHQSASDMTDLVQRMTGAAGGAAAPEAGGTSIQKTMRVDSELTFRDLRIRVVRVNENDNNDDNDDSVEMVIRTPTTSEERTITEFRSEFVQDYEISVEEVRPSGNNEGSARIEVRYNPQGLRGTGPNMQ